MEKYCLHCGAKIGEGEKFCQNCGASVEEVKDEVVSNAQENIQNTTVDNMQNNINNGPAKTNGMAIASFVCSLVGIILFGFIMGILAISLGVSARKRIEVFNNNEKGKGLALAGIIIGIVDIVFTAIGLILKAAL